MLVEQRFEFEVIENAQDVYFFLSINPFYLFDIIPNLRVPLFDRSIKKLIYWLTIALKLTGGCVLWPYVGATTTTHYG